MKIMDIYDYNYYKIQYMSSYLMKSDDYKETLIMSNKELQIGSYIIIEKTGQGLFLGKVLEKWDNNQGVPKTCLYKYVQDIDLTSYFQEKEKEKRRKELEKKMEEEYARIDKMSKWEYYAAKDATFNKLLEEYKNL
jgi:hypothetical protein